MQAMDDDTKWEALNLLAAEALAEDDAGQTEEITGEGFLS